MQLDYPTGNTKTPVNNLPDALVKCRVWNNDSSVRAKTLEIREILMEGHRESELLTPIPTGN